MELQYILLAMLPSQNKNTIKIFLSPVYKLIAKYKRPFSFNAAMTGALNTYLSAFFPYANDHVETIFFCLITFLNCPDNVESLRQCSHSYLLPECNENP